MTRRQLVLAIVVGACIALFSKEVLAEEQVSFTAQQAPEATFALYVESAKRHITDPDLGIFTPASREFLRSRTSTELQLDQVYLLYADRPYRVLTQHDRAVIRFDLTDSQRSPFFLQRDAEGWKLDLATMAEVIHYNNLNKWHFVHTNHPYMFAFEDATFDERGFPHPILEDPQQELREPPGKARTPGVNPASPKAVVAELRRLLKARDFMALERWVEQLARTGHDDYLGDVVKLIYEVPEALPALNAWSSQWPHSSWARLFRGSYYLDAAWEARGSGWAQEVSAEGASLFLQRLQRAATELEEAVRLNPSDPTAPALLMRVVLGMGGSRTDLNGQFERATRIAPYHYWAHHYKLLYLLPRWYGFPGEALAFATTVSASAPQNSRASLLIGRAHYEFYDEPDERRRHLADSQVWDAISSAFTTYFQYHPEDIRMHNYYAKYAYTAGQYAVAKSELDLIGDDWDSACWSKDFFDRVRHYVYQKAARP